MRRTTPERRTSKARRCSGTTARSEGRATRTKRDVIFTVPATLLPLQLRIGVIAWSMPPASGRSSADPGAWRPGRPSMPSCSVRAILARSGRWPGRRTRRSRRGGRREQTRPDLERARPHRGVARRAAPAARRGPAPRGGQPRPPGAHRLPRARARADAREGSPRDFDVVMPPDDRPGSAGPGPVKERRGDQTVRYAATCGEPGTAAVPVEGQR